MLRAVSLPCRFLYLDTCSLVLHYVCFVGVCRLQLTLHKVIISPSLPAAERMLALIATVQARMSERQPVYADQLKSRSQRRGSACSAPAETYVLGGSHTHKAAATGRLLCSVLGTQHCHLTDGLWVDNVSAPSLLKRMRVPPELQHIYPLKKLGILNAHFDAWGAISEQGRSSSEEWVVFLEGSDAMLNPLLTLGRAEKVKRVVPRGLKEALCSRAAVQRGLVYLGRCSNSLKLPNATALPPDSCAEHTSLSAFGGKLTVASCTNTLCTHAYAIQRRVASDLYSNLFATYNICSFHRCNTDRALDVYTKVIKKYRAAVVLHAPKKQHVFMSYDGLFVQRKGRYRKGRYSAQRIQSC